jgi:hypothetical protein
MNGASPRDQREGRHRYVRRPGVAAAFAGRRGAHRAVPAGRAGAGPGELITAAALAALREVATDGGRIDAAGAHHRHLLGSVHFDSASATQGTCTRTRRPAEDQEPHGHLHGGQPGRREQRNRHHRGDRGQTRHVSDAASVTASNVPPTATTAPPHPRPYRARPRVRVITAIEKAVAGETDRSTGMVTRLRRRAAPPVAPGRVRPSGAGRNEDVGVPADHGGRCGVGQRQAGPVTGVITDTVSSASLTT